GRLRLAWNGQLYKTLHARPTPAIELSYVYGRTLQLGNGVLTQGGKYEYAQRYTAGRCPTASTVQSTPSLPHRVSDGRPPGEPAARWCQHVCAGATRPRLVVPGRARPWWPFSTCGL